MKKIKKVSLLLLLVLVVVLLGIFLFLNTLKPTYNGKKELPGLSDEVSVYYDDFGIPHIYGKTEKDAFKALGYVHAQDRLWQMELLRRVGRGGLSEVFGKELLGTDKFFLSLGIEEASKDIVTALQKDKQMVQLAEAYLSGINEFIAKGPTPIEFYLTGLDKTPFTLVDMYNAIGYMSFSFAMAHKTDPLLSNIKEELGVAYLEDLEIEIDSTTTLIERYSPSDTLQNSIAETTLSALDKLPIPQFIGSNGWVVGPEKTKTGKVLFANDPHIGFAQPSVWYEAHLSTPTYEKYGYYLAGIPFPLLAHDRNLAYGLTMFENDDINFYYEKEHPTDSTKYKNGTTWESFEVVHKTIRVKGEETVDFSFKKTRNGPVLNNIANQIKGERPISMSWIYTQLPNKLLDAFYGMSHATNFTEFKTALPNIHAPGLNVMYGDAEGNIGWWATAALYQMPDSVNTKFILEGDTDKQKPVRFLNFSENPQATNPPWHYVYSANNQPEAIEGILYPGYYLSENRAKRIQQLLANKGDWDMSTMQTMITDITSVVNPSIIMDLAKSLDVKALSDEELQLLDRLNTWQGDYPLKSTEAVVFHRWIYYFLKNTFHDELGEDRFDAFLNTHFHKRLIAPMAKPKASVWWDNVNTKDKTETQEDIIQNAFAEALLSLSEEFGSDSSQWTWDKVHTVEYEHPIGRVSYLRSFFNVGPFPVAGSREVINNLSFSYKNENSYKVNVGPSTRRIIDFSDIEHSKSILPTGQSGNPFSPHYRDQAQMYINGEFREMLLNSEEIERTAPNTLLFEPKK